MAGGLRSGSGGPQSQGFSANCYLCVLRVEEKDTVSANLFSSVEYLCWLTLVEIKEHSCQIKTSKNGSKFQKVGCL